MINMLKMSSSYEPQCDSRLLRLGYTAAEGMNKRSNCPWAVSSARNFSLATSPFLSQSKHVSNSFENFWRRSLLLKYQTTIPISTIRLNSWCASFSVPRRRILFDNVGPADVNTQHRSLPAAQSHVCPWYRSGARILSGG